MDWNVKLHGRVTLSVPGPYTDRPPWRNRLARSAVNRKVGGSSPPRDVAFSSSLPLCWGSISFLPFHFALIIIFSSPCYFFPHRGFDPPSYFTLRCCALSRKAKVSVSSIFTVITILSQSPLCSLLWFWLDKGCHRSEVLIWLKKRQAH